MNGKSKHIGFQVLNTAPVKKLNLNPELTGGMKDVCRNQAEPFKLNLIPFIGMSKENIFEMYSKDMCQLAKKNVRGQRRNFSIWICLKFFCLPIRENSLPWISKVNVIYNLENKHINRTIHDQNDDQIQC